MKIKITRQEYDEKLNEITAQLGTLGGG